MNDKKIIIGFILFTLIILGGGVFFLSKDSSSVPQISASQNAKANVLEKNYNWGKIPYNGGVAKKTFTIKNSGSDVLKLSEIKTSCACTKAFVIINNEASPDFSMHSVSSWVGQVSPGKEAKLTVVFDPTFHGPSGVGPMTRLISVKTNDSNNPTLEFTLTGNVVR